MRKNSFITGTFITTLCILITKILGAIYVIPFYAVVGNTGGALYGYAYTVYLFFMSLSSAGIPLATSRLVSEYQTLGYVKAKKRTFQLVKKIVFLFSIVCFIIIFLFAPLLARGIVGNISGASSIKDVSFVIRIIGIAIIIVPVLSVYRGYFEGHRFMIQPSLSQVIEQFVRILVIIFGSFLAIKVFKLNIASAVGIALLGVSVGALCAYFYLFDKLSKNKNKFNKQLIKKNEPIINDKIILKKIIEYALPFIMIDLFKSLYNYIDMFEVVRALVSVRYKARDAETIYSILSTWGAKFNMIILAINSGIIVNLIPNLTEKITKGEYSEANKSIIKSVSMLLFIGIPLVFGISFLAKPIWYLFYGDSLYGANILSYYIFVGLFISLATISITILQCYKDYKSMFISLFIGVVLKLLLNINLLVAFNKMSLPAYYGIITATIIGYLATFIINLIVLGKKYNVKYEGLVKSLFDIIIGSIIMIFVLFILSFIIPIYSNNRIINLFIIFFYGICGILIYFVYSCKIGLFYVVFEKKFINMIK